MNFQVPAIQEDSKNIIKVHSEGSVLKKKKKKRKKTKRNFSQVSKKNIQKEKQTQIAVSMSSWAESFTVAATWQLKHQLAFWKARAKSLEYENNILHGIICKQVKDRTLSDNSSSKMNEESEDEENECNNDEENECNNDEENESDNDEPNTDLEVSEEFIQFLTANAKYREDAKRERELLKAKSNADNEQHLETMEILEESIDDKKERSKKLYGNNWERIAAIEIALQASFNDECDKKNPIYWPNIPFNFSFT